MRNEMQNAIEYFTDAVTESDGIINNCSPLLQAKAVQKLKEFDEYKENLFKKASDVVLNEPEEYCEKCCGDCPHRICGKKSKWISVKDRLPAPITLSLVCIEGVENSVLIATFNGEKWYRNNREIFVTHWMPMPEPPEED